MSTLHIGADKPARKGEEQAFTVAVHAEHPQVILPCGTSLASNTDTANMAYNREASAWKPLVDQNPEDLQGILLLGPYSSACLIPGLFTDPLKTPV